MKFGVAIEAPVEWPELLALAQEIDRNSRYDFFWISDALAGTPADAPRLEAWSALAAIAHATSRVRVGVFVSSNVYRHPSLLAKMATTVDHISDGRLELALGAGWPGDNLAYGIPFGKRRERRERLAEAVQVIKLLWTQEQPVFHGKYYTLDSPHFSPLPLQRPHPPIQIGAAHDELIRLAARHADAFNRAQSTTSLDVEAGRTMETLDRYAREAGRDPRTIRRTVELQMFFHDDPGVQARAIQAAAAGYNMTEDQVLNTSLFGSAQDIRARVERLVEEGVQELYIFQLPHIHRKSLLRFSEEIIPAFQ